MRTHRWSRTINELPTGVVTFLFTDIEGSTRLWDRSPNDMKTALSRHDEILRAAITFHGGHVFKYVGDAVYAAFSDADEAVAAAVDAQAALHSEAWPADAPIRVRIALNSGPAERLENDYVGATLNRCARILDLARGGQTLLSMSTRNLLTGELPQGATLVDLAAHRLRDLSLPERIFQLRHPALPRDDGPLRSGDERPTNLPVHHGRLVGRQAETAEIVRLLQTNGLITLTGVGGIGKSRLAHHVATSLREEFRDGVWIAGMAPLEEPGFVPQRVASALGLPSEPGLTFIETLIAYVSQRHLLLVLDDCEHLVEACASLAAAILQAGSGVRLLVTSREALDIEAEVVWDVPPLSLPDPEHMDRLSGATLVAYVSGYASVELFSRRARQASDAFQVTPDNARSVAEVCVRLDGVPLAIELAAVRLKVMTLDQILSRLGDRFQLLTDGRRDVPARQQTLKALIDWSYGLLLDRERELFNRLAVFRGGWTLDAAEAICKDESDAGDVLELIGRLAAKSLVRVREVPSGIRYEFLHTIHEYAWQAFKESSDYEAVHWRFARWFLGLAEEAAPHLAGPDQASWMNRLDRDRHNLRAVLTWATRRASETGDKDAAEIAGRMAGALVGMWVNRGRLNEGREMMARVLALPMELVHGPVRARVCVGAGLLASQQGDMNEARRRATEALSLYRDVGDEVGMAEALDVLSRAAQHQGDIPAAYEYTEACLSLHQDTGNRAGVATALQLLGQIAWQRGDLATAGERMGASLEMRRELGDERGVAVGLNALAALRYARGDLEQANELFMESLEIVQRLGDQRSLGLVLHNLGQLAFEKGNFDGARPLLEESLQVKRLVGDRRGEANTLTVLGELALAEGDNGDAERQIQAGLQVRRALADHVGVAESLEASASLARAKGQADVAARLLGAAASLRWEIGAPVKGFEERAYASTLAATRETLGEAEFAALWADGREAPWQSAVTLALGED